MTRLLVPVSLDALVVRPGTTPGAARTAWAAPRRPPIGSLTRQALAPPPFTDLPAPRPEGVHLHWAVPDALSLRTADADQFPPLPSRWLIVRLDGLADAATPRRITAWMLPNIHAEPSTVVPEGQRTAQRVGSANAPVSVRGRGGDGPHPSWALDYDDTALRLSFHDPLIDAKVTGPLAYTVIGWYSHLRLDPLVPPDGTPATPSWLHDLLTGLGWTVDLPPGVEPPTASMYHGSTLALGWPDPRWPGDDDGSLAAEVGGLPTVATMRTALADNLVSAVAALLDGEVPAAVAAVSEAVLTGSVAQLSQPDGAARLDTIRHQSRFRGIAPTTRDRDVIYEEAAPAPPSAPVPPGLAAAVDAATPTAVGGDLVGLTAALAAAAASPADAAPTGLIEVSYPTPRQWRPGDPVVAVTNLGRTLRHGGDGRFHPLGLLDCRVSGQTVTAPASAALPTWPVADDVPAEVTALVMELAALDPGSVAGLATAGAVAPEAAARAAWWETWTSETVDAWRTAPAGTGWTGVLPSPVGVSRPAHPWNPLRLDWQIEFVPSPTGPSHWQLGELDFAPAEPFDTGAATPIVVSGIGWLSPAPADLVRAAARRPGATGRPNAAEYADTVAAALEGFVDRLRGVPQGVWVGPRGVEDSPPRAALDAETYQPRSHIAGIWRLTRLRTVDTFGQFVVLYDPTGAAPQASPPIVPTELRMPGVDGLAWRPRFTAPATLSVRFLDPEPGSNQDAVAGRNPVCGFFVPSPFDATLEIVDPAGTSLARLRLDPRSARTVMEDTPGADPTQLSGALRLVADSLVAADQAAAPHSPDSSALSTLLRIVNATRAAVDVTGRAGDSQLALLLGHPLCLVRIGLTLSIDDPQGRTGNAAVATPVRLGSLSRLDDGVLAWFLEDPPTQLHPIHDAVRAAADETVPDPLAPFVGDPLVWLTPGVPRTVLVLLVPAADLTAVSGLLPQKQLEMVREWTDQPLRKLTPTLGFDAVLRDPAAVAMPVPGGVHGTWTWYTRPGPGLPWAAEPVSADPTTAQPGTPVAVEDGYLRVTLIPYPPYHGDPVPVDCVRLSPAGTVIELGGTNPDGSRWRMPITKAIQLVEEGRLWLHVPARTSGADPVDVTVTVDGAGAKGLRAVAPGGTTDLLVGLDRLRDPLLVPNVVDLPIGAATTTIIAAGLTVGVVRREFDVMPVDQVIRQSPPAGVEAGPGNTVDLTVSLGPPVLVPDVVGLPLGGADTTITAVDLTVGAITRGFDARAPREHVIAQQPQPDTEVAKAAPVDLTVSLGPAVTVPDVVGLPLGAATTAIQSAGLIVGAVAHQLDAGMPLDHVINQQPPGGTQAAAGDAVTLTVSDGPPVTVPDVVGQTDEAAANALIALGLSVNLIRDQDSRPRNTVIGQHPTGDTKVRRGAVVELTVSAGEVVVPYVVGQLLTDAEQNIIAAGLGVGQVQSVASPTRANEVLTQLPLCGQRVSGDATVDLTYSTGHIDPPTVGIGVTHGPIPPFGVDVPDPGREPS